MRIFFTSDTHIIKGNPGRGFPTINATVISQLDYKDRIQGVVTFSELEQWYKKCLSENYRGTLGKELLQNSLHLIAL